MRRKITIVLAVILAAGVLGGCGTELTDTERKLIAGYAADVLLRYDKGYNEKYLEGAATEAPVITAEPEVTEPPVTEAPVITEPETPATPVVTDIPGAHEIDVQEVTQQAAEPEQKSPYELGQLFGMEGVELHYIGMETGPSYPQGADGELNFKVDATSGAKLVALKFELFNVSDGARTCNIVGQNIKFRACFNGTDNINVQKTLLVNDLAMMNVILQPNEKKEAVVICQVKDGYEATISSISLTIRIAGENFNVKLQ